MKTLPALEGSTKVLTTEGSPEKERFEMVPE